MSAGVCVYVCSCVCMFVSVCLCMFVCLCLYMSVCVYVYVCSCDCIFMYVHASVCLLIFVYLCSCMLVYVYTLTLYIQRVNAVHMCVNKRMCATAHHPNHSYIYISPKSYTCTHFPLPLVFAQEPPCTHTDAPPPPSQPPLSLKRTSRYGGRARGELPAGGADAVVANGVQGSRRPHGRATSTGLLGEGTQLRSEGKRIREILI